MQIVGINSFPSSLRLKTSREFGIVRRMGCSIHTPHFILLKMPADDNFSRLGLTVSRKVGNAVCRNRVKRLLREYFRRHHHFFDPPVILSVIAKKNSGRVTARMIEQELNILIKKG
ncbi:MAG: ribonuclease P protein component [Desulfuromonadales bacterium]|nr:ribonuclease P protein component [Desulfuromonadales bacterium]